MSETAFERCKVLGGKIKVIVVNDSTGEKRRVCFGAKSKDPKTGKMIPWGPVAEDKVYSSKTSKQK